MGGLKAMQSFVIRKAPKETHLPASNHVVREQSILVRDWDEEFRKAQELLEELTKEDGLRTLLSEATLHVEAARKARDLKMDAQVAHELGALEGIRRRVDATLYQNRLTALGISTREIINSDVRRDADTWKNILSSNQGFLIAMCADVARRDFPHLEIQVLVEHVASQNQGGSAPVISVGDKLFSPYRSGQDFFVKIQNEEKEHFFVMANPVGEVLYAFSREDIRPFAFSEKKSKERFVIPSIIENSWIKQNEGRLPSHVGELPPYAFSLVASSFGMTEEVCKHAEGLIKREIGSLLRDQGIDGEFVSREEQEKLGSLTPLLPVLRRRRVILNRELLNWFHKFTTLSIDSVAPDISLESPDENLVFCAEIKEITYFKEKYHPRGSYEKEREEKKYNISFFLIIGPWAYKISAPLGDNQKKELVKTLPHSIKKEKVKEPYHRY